MILVLSLNTALDKTLLLGRLARGRRHLPAQNLDLAGGKGVNAARALRRLGRQARVLGLLAGHTGRHIAGLLADEGVPADWVWLPRGESRTCLTVVHGGMLPTEINEAGPAVPRASLARLEALLRRRLKGCRFLLLCGRLPPGVPADYYGRLIRLARSRGVPTALDASAPALAPGLAAGPDLVKPNAVELAELGLSARPRHWKASLERLGAMGAKEVFVTLGPLGALMKTGSQALHASGPRFRGCPLGSGDTFLAAAVHGLLAGWPAERRLAFAVAAASANVRTLGAGVFLKKHLRALLPKVRVRRLQA
ncbi:MAG: hexose kinase [Elusimicrobia bacterium]|nr:hexose kinase [Elusimicrobiota bacterium]